MNTKPRIKVIKLAERKRRARARVKQERASARRPRQDDSRDAAATVTGWVDELRRQKQQAVETQGDFDSLFEDPA